MPLARPVKLKLPLLSVVVVAPAAPLRATLTPVPLVAGLILPEMLKLEPEPETVKSIPVILVVLRTVLWLEGLKLKPVSLGVKV